MSRPASTSQASQATRRPGRWASFRALAGRPSKDRSDAGRLSDALSRVGRVGRPGVDWTGAGLRGAPGPGEGPDRERLQVVRRPEETVEVNGGADAGDAATPGVLPHRRLGPGV